MRRKRTVTFWRGDFYVRSLSDRVPSCQLQEAWAGGEDRVACAVRTSNRGSQWVLHKSSYKQLRRKKESEGLRLGG